MPSEPGERRAEPEHRLNQAYRRYDLAYRSARPGTRSAFELALARLDLALVLHETNEPLPQELLDQIFRDTDSIMRATPPLALDHEDHP